jgi:hypothetical protein
VSTTVNQIGLNTCVIVVNETSNYRTTSQIVQLLEAERCPQLLYRQKDRVVANRLCCPDEAFECKRLAWLNGMDGVVVTPRECETDAGIPGPIVRPAVREGQVLYVRG